MRYLVSYVKGLHISELEFVHSGGTWWVSQFSLSDFSIYKISDVCILLAKNMVEKGKAAAHSQNTGFVCTEKNTFVFTTSKFTSTP